MKWIFAVSSLAAAIAAGPAQADKGFSAGASLGYSNVTLGDSGVNVDFTDVGYKVFATYMFSNNLGFEGGWLDFGDLAEDIGGVEAEIDADGYDLFAVGSLPLSDTFDLFGKAGLVSWDASTNIGGFGKISDSGEDLAFGIGGRLIGAGGLGLRAEYEWFDIEDTDIAWMVSAGFEYAFK